MRCRSALLVAVLVSLYPALRCSREKTDDKGLVRIGRRTVTQREFTAFETMMNLHPDPGEIGILRRGAPISAMIETEVLSRGAGREAGMRGGTDSESDRQWKEKHFLSQLYSGTVLRENWGFTQKEIRKLYQEHRDEYADTVGSGDSTGRDSVRIPDLDEIKYELVEEMFYRANPPDSAALANMDNPDDSAEARDYWLYYVRRNRGDFFAKKFHREFFNAPWPDSAAQWYMERKIITDDDLDIVMQWIPDHQRAYYRDEEGRRRLARYMIEWYLFSRKAKKSGFHKEFEPEHVLEWARKADEAAGVARMLYENKAALGLVVDTGLITFLYWDRDTSALYSPPDKELLKSEIEKQRRMLQDQAYAEIIHDMRKKAGVTFLQSDYTDDVDRNPDSLLARADTLREKNKVSAAKALYQSLIDHYAWHTEGRKAYMELARIEMDEGLYADAIKHYRMYTALSADPGEKCKAYFMAGYIYDEFLKHYPMAEVNYKWILRHAPHCELANDAEFMINHLNEGIYSIEELRDEATRQGRFIEEEEGDREEEDSLEAGM